MFCIPGLGRLDDCAVLVVADALKRAGIDARVAGATTAIEDGEAASICVCYLENVPKARTDYAVRKLSRKAPSARIVDLPVERSRADRTFGIAAESGATLAEGHCRRFRKS